MMLQPRESNIRKMDRLIREIETQPMMLQARTAVDILKVMALEISELREEVDAHRDLIEKGTGE